MTPAAVRVMTPEETALLIDGWNEAQRAATGQVDAPTADEMAALRARYG